MLGLSPVTDQEIKTACYVYNIKTVPRPDKNQEIQS